MNTSRFSSIYAFLKRNGIRIFVPLLLLVLSLMSYLICREPASGGLPVSETCTRLLLPAVSILSIVSAALARYYASLSLFVGYHAGIALAMIGTNRETEALLIVAITLLIFLILGVWAEVFAVLLPKWSRAQHHSGGESS